MTMTTEIGTQTAAWLTDTGNRIASTTPSPWTCQRGHTEHATTPLLVVLDGPTDRVPDFPPVPHRLALSVPMAVWAWRDYLATGAEYCPGRDIISECLETQGTWEGYGTNTVLDWLARTPGPVIDCGAQIGWYSMLAARNGHAVLAIDADEECLDLVRTSSVMGGCDDLVWTCRTFLNLDVPQVDLPPDGVQVALLKIDVEGAENHALRVFGPLIRAGRVDALLIEVSPCFDDYYPQMVVELAEAGYVPYLIPGKNENLDAWAADPLGALAACQMPAHPGPLAAEVASFHQRDIFFVRGGL